VQCLEAVVAHDGDLLVFPLLTEFLPEAATVVPGLGLGPPVLQGLHSGDDRVGPTLQVAGLSALHVHGIAKIVVLL